MWWSLIGTFHCFLLPIYPSRPWLGPCFNDMENQGFSPLRAVFWIFAPSCLKREPCLFKDSDGRSISCIARRTDPFQTKILESQLEQQHSNLGCISAAPIVSIQGVANFPGLGYL